MPTAERLPSWRYRALAWDSANKMYELVRNTEPGSRGTWACESDALTAARGREREMDRTCVDHGVPVMRSRPRLTFADCATRWLRSEADREERPAKNTLASYAVSVRALTAYFGPELLVGDVTGGRVDELLRFLREKKKLAPGTRLIRLNALRKIMAYAVTHGLRRGDEPDPTAGRKVTVPKRPLSKARILDEDELARAVVHLPTWFRPGALLAYDCGLRQCEVAGLRWGNLNLKDPLCSTVHVTEMMDRDRVPRDGTKGSDDDAPAIPIKPRTALALIELRTAHPGEDDDHVFRTPKKTGPEPVRPTHINAMWSTARKRAGLNVTTKPNARFHDLRHATATNLAEQGHPAWIVRDALRHRDIATSARYVRLTPDAVLREAMTGVPRLRAVGDS